MSPDLFIWERSTYSLFDWCGDLGGLYDGLYYFIRAVLSPISAFALRSTVLTNFFRFRTS